MRFELWKSFSERVFLGSVSIEFSRVIKILTVIHINTPGDAKKVSLLINVRTHFYNMELYLPPALFTLHQECHFKNAFLAMPAENTILKIKSCLIGFKAEI